MKTQTIRLSKTETIIKCCIAAVSIALLIHLIGKADMHQFVINILDWDSI